LQTPKSLYQNSNSKKNADSKKTTTKQTSLKLLILKLNTFTGKTQAKTAPQLKIFKKKSFLLPLSFPRFPQWQNNRQKQICHTKSCKQNFKKHTGQSLKKSV